jgi:hypothetical protein
MTSNSDIHPIREFVLGHFRMSSVYESGLVFEFWTLAVNTPHITMFGGFENNAYRVIVIHHGPGRLYLEIQGEAYAESTETWAMTSLQLSLNAPERLISCPT